MADDLPTLTFASQADWETWLDAQHAGSRGVWIKIAKKATGILSTTHAEALESALCYGWIDGQRASFDETYFLQKFTPRRPRSGWSRVNRERALELIAAGRMRPRGLREMSGRKRWRWEPYDRQSAIAVQTTSSVS